MLLDFEVQRSTRRCAATDRPLEPGELSYSVLEVNGADVVRKDYCSEAWTGPPESALGWWKARVPEPTAKKVKLAPNDVLLELFDELADRPEQSDLRYVLVLLLIRRRVLRLDAPTEIVGTSTRHANVESSHETMSVYCPKRETTYSVPAVMPDPARIDEIQQQLSDLLIAGAE
jgi:hypothetical protein